MINLTTPISNDTVENLKIGDKILISGTIYTARDQAHKRMIEQDYYPFNVEGSVIFYVGPTPKRDNKPIGSSGPTSSYRMDKVSEPLLKKGLKVTIGKGDRSQEFRDLLIKYKSIYLIATGGAGALLSSKIKTSEVIAFEDLGSEAIRKLEVIDFPCYVAYDCYGNSIFERGRSNE